MKRCLLLMALISLTVAASAQTRDLLRKSIGGDVDLGAVTEADFGLPGWAYFSKVDTVIRTSDSTAIQVTSMYHRRSATDSGTFQQRYRQNIPLKPKRTGAETKKALLEEFHNQYDPEEIRNVQFVGFDDSTATTKQKTRHPVRTAHKLVRKEVSAAPAAAAPVLRRPSDHAPLFAGGTALFALGLCAGIIGLYRRAGASS